MGSYYILIFTRISLLYDKLSFERKDSLFFTYFELLFISIEFKLQINFFAQKKIYLNIFYNIMALLFLKLLNLCINIYVWTV